MKAGILPAATPVRFAAPMLALAIMTGLLAWRYGQESERLAKFDRYSLPAFDAHVYLAMAERPEVFTVAPWGYRWLGPAIVHALPGEASPDSFLRLAVTCLALSGVALFGLLRRVGARRAGALLGVLLFGMSEPVRETFLDPLLAEPVGILLWIGVLLAAETGMLGALSLLLTLGALTKEVFLLFLPGLVLVLRPRFGLGRAIAATLVTALPAVLATLVLRFGWLRLPAEAGGLPGTGALLPALGAMLETLPDWGLPALLAGVLPLALLGALRRGARPLLERYGLLAVLTVGLPFAAGSYVGETALAATFFPRDVTRLLIYSVPVLLPLALHGLGLIQAGEPTERSPRVRPIQWVLGSAALLVALSPAGVLDGYRRADLRGPRDGQRVLAFCRQSLAMARRLGRGRLVDYEVRERKYYIGRSYHHYLERMRWFLMSGWGNKPHYGTGTVEMLETRATFVLPCFDPQPVLLVLGLGASRDTPVGVEINGTPVGVMLASPGIPRGRFRVPPELLFRGDNEVALVAKRPEDRVTLELVRARAILPE